MNQLKRKNFKMEKRQEEYNIKGTKGFHEEHKGFSENVILPQRVKRNFTTKYTKDFHKEHKGKSKR
jgi:hypothetical protein